MFHFIINVLTTTIIIIQINRTTIIITWFNYILISFFITIIANIYIYIYITFVYNNNNTTDNNIIIKQSFTFIITVLFVWLRDHYY